MSALEELKRALEAVVTEEKRLELELGKVRSVRAALEKGIKVQSSSLPNGGKAGPGVLKKAILGVLGTQPMSNSDIRAALTAAKYEYSLSPLHVTKTLIMLLAAKQVVRVGKGTAAAYKLAKR